MNALKSTNEPITLKEAADLLGTSRSRVWRAMNDGELLAEKIRINGRKTWCVRPEDLEEWAKTWMDSSEMNAVNEQAEQPEKRSAHSEHTEERSSNTSSERSEQTAQALHSSPPAEVYGMLVDRLTRAERKNVELEILLRQHQNLLTENAESLQEDRAKALEQQERVKERDEENAQLRAELESLRTDLATKEAEWSEQRRPWWKKMWGKAQ